MVGVWCNLSTVASAAGKRFGVWALDFIASYAQHGSSKAGPVSDLCNRPSSKSLSSPADGGFAVAQQFDRPLTTASRYDVNHRALLFSSRFGKVGTITGKGHTAADIYSANERAMLEAQNEELVAELGEKVVALKTVCVDIGREASESNSVVNAMGDDLETARRLLDRVTGRVQNIAKQAGGRRLWLVVVLTLVALALLHALRPAGIDDRKFLSAAPAQNVEHGTR